MWHINKPINDINKPKKNKLYCIYDNCFNNYLNIDYKIQTYDITKLTHDDTYSDIESLSEHKYIFIYNTKNVNFVEYIYYNSILLNVIPIFINKNRVCILDFYKNNIDNYNIINNLPKNINDIPKLFPYNNFLVKQDNIKNNIIQSHIRNTINDIDKGITFTITTCKRYEKFVETMDNFLNKCLDHDIITKWICIDDNSKLEDRINMKNKYPFFEFIFKNQEDKGHAKSLNILWSKIETPFIFQMEDDWIIHDNFSIYNIINNFKYYNVTQIILGSCHGNGIKLNSDLNLKKYCFNKKTSIMPNDILAYKNAENVLLSNSSENFWWPGFTLHPSIIYFKKIKNEDKFCENIKNYLFEYKFSLNLFEKFHKILYCGYNVGHTGNISSYDLNNEKR